MKSFRVNLNVLILSLIGFIFASSSESNRLSWRIFTKEPNTWVYNKEGLIIFSTQSRTVRMFDIDASRKVDSLVDCIEGEGYLWVSANSGIYQIDMGTESVERLPSPPEDSTATGKVALDADYLWLGTIDKLFRFDRLAREWFPFSLPAKVDKVIGLWANGEEVFVLGNNILYRFTTSTEKWNQYPLEKPFSEASVFYPGKNGFKVLDGGVSYLYKPESYSWVITNIGKNIIDLFDNGNDIYYTDGSNVKVADCVNSIIRSYTIPNINEVGALTLVKDSLILCMPNSIGFFSIKTENVNFFKYEKELNITQENILKMLPIQEFIVLITTSDIIIYEKKTKAWKYISRKEFKKREKIFVWNEENFIINYGKNIKSTLKGYAEFDFSLKYAGLYYDTIDYKEKNINGVSTWVPVIDSGPFFTASSPIIKGALTFHTSDNKDRVMDIYIKNDSKISAPQKGIYYRGNKDDYLNSLQVGSTDNSQMSNSVLPLVTTEGGSFILQSKKRLEKRDRKVLSFSGGGGYITSRTVVCRLSYRSDGIYRLGEDTSTSDTANIDTIFSSEEDGINKQKTKIIPGSIKVMVDGVVLDSTYYTFYTTTNTLQFSPLSPIDPVSSITVEYKIQPIPKGKISDIELIPSNNFGRVYYNSFLISPVEWISAKIGVTGLKREADSSLDYIINTSLPLEFRGEGERKYLLKFLPDLSYNISQKAMAIGGTLQGRIGKTSGLLLNYKMLDPKFVSTDTITRGLGRIEKEYDMTLHHEILQEIPLTYYQHQRVSDIGLEDRFEAKISFRFPGLPYLDVSGSRTILEERKGVERNTVLDSNFYKKDRIYLRLYETSSKLLEKITRFQKISYEIGHSEYRTRFINDYSWNYDRVTNAQFTIIPLKEINLLGNLLYKGDINLSDSTPTSEIIPNFTLKILDLPKGLDLFGLYSINFKKYAVKKFSNDTISRSINLTLRPGQWFKYFNWVTPRVQITQKICSDFNKINVSGWEIINGGNWNDEKNILYLKEVGASFFPWDWFLLNNINRWDGKNLYEWNNFKTTNYLQLIFNARNIVTGTYTFSREKLLHSGMITYQKIWTPWITTTPSININSQTDSLGNLIVAGPGLMVNLNLFNWGFLKSFNNSHDIQIKFNRINGTFKKFPKIDYVFYINIRILPNIEFVNNELLSLSSDGLNDFKSSLNIISYF